MKQRLFLIFVLACIMISLLAACNSGGAITAEEAQQIVLEHAGVSESEASDLHPHITTNEDGTACYSIHITVNGETLEYLVHGKTGEILSVGEGGH